LKLNSIVALLVIVRFIDWPVLERRFSVNSLGKFHRFFNISSVCPESQGKGTCAENLLAMTVFR